MRLLKKEPTPQAPRSPRAEAQARWRKNNPEAHRAQQNARWNRKREAAEALRRAQAAEAELRRLYDIEVKNEQRRKEQEAEERRPRTAREIAEAAAFDRLFAERCPDPLAECSRAPAQTSPDAPSKPKQPHAEIVVEDVAGMLVEDYRWIID